MALTGRQPVYRCLLKIANKEFNARNQVTLWGPTGQINDYAAKHWQGLMGDYYGRRWKLFVSYLLDVRGTGRGEEEQGEGKCTQGVARLANALICTEEVN